MSEKTPSDVLDKNLGRLLNAASDASRPSFEEEVVIIGGKKQIKLGDIDWKE